MFKSPVNKFFLGGSFHCSGKRLTDFQWPISLFNQPVQRISVTRLYKASANKSSNLKGNKSAKKSNSKFALKPFSRAEKTPKQPSKTGKAIGGKKFISTKNSQTSKPSKAVRSSSSKHAKKNATSEELRHNGAEIDKKLKSKLYFNYGLNYGRLVEKSGDVVPEVSVIDKITTFEELKLLPETRALVKDIIFHDSIMTNESPEDIVPSPIQIQSIFTINKYLDKMDSTDKSRHGKMKIYTIAAETGSGKTMAYVAPLLDYLNRYPSTATKNAIRSVILLPSQELIHQLYTTLQSSSASSFSVVKWDNTVSYNDIVEKIKSKIDILITTPGKISETLFSINKVGHPQSLLNHTDFAIIDEADTLMSKTFLDSTKAAIKRLPNLNHLLFCSATIPKEFHTILNSMFLEKSNIIITTPKLHRLSHNLKFFTVDSTLSPLKGNKIKALEQVLTAINNDNTEPNVLEKRCIVFVNKKSTVDEIVGQLHSKYAKLIGFSGSDTPEDRLEKIKPFVNPPNKYDLEELSVEAQDLDYQEEVQQDEFKRISGSNIEIPKNYKAFQNDKATVIEKLNVLVTTDLLARGLNFNGVRNVILYDVPQTSIDLIHRCGRTARYKQGGRVFMITDKTTKAWAKAIPTIIKKRKSLT
ncbi:hypothetical protein ACO0QE_003572 [Hanseniaspora vineae]